MCAFIFHVLLITKSMKTPLALRPVNVRLAVAYMAHAAIVFKNRKPGNSFTRFGDFCKTFVDDCAMTPWFTMWCSIGTFYDKMEFGNMSDEEIIEQYNGALRVGFVYHTKIEASAVQSAVKAWSDRGWKRYLQRSASRHKWTGRVAIVTALACVGAPPVPNA
jgi:hypothetical protein